MNEPMEICDELGNTSIDGHEVDWFRLDDFTWQNILLNLDKRSMLDVMKTCKYFENLVTTSTNLMKKLKIVIRFPESENLHEVEARLMNYSQLTRPYQHLSIIRLRDAYLKNHNAGGKRWNFFKLIKKLASTVKVLTVENCNVLRRDLVSLLLPFKHLQECSFENLMLFDQVMLDEQFRQLQCNNIKRLVLSECDFFCMVMFQDFNQLEYLKVKNPVCDRPDVELFENFLLKQKNLKELVLQNFRFNSTYSTNRLASVPFQLDTLRLHGVNWDMVNHCEAFLKSQTNLKILKLSNFNRWITPWADNALWFMRVMSHIFAKNQKLKSVTLDLSSNLSFQEFKDEEFLPDVVNTSVEQLTYVEDKSELLKIYTRMFPNVKSITYKGGSSERLQLLQHFKRLESLKLTVVPKALENFTLGTSTLHSFHYCALNEEKSSEKLTKLFMQNPTVKHLFLNIEPLTVEEISEMTIPFTQTLETLTFSDLHLNLTEAELFTSNFSRLRKIRTDFQLPLEVVNFLKDRKITFEFFDGGFFPKK